MTQQEVENALKTILEVMQMNNKHVAKVLKENQALKEKAQELKLKLQPQLFNDGK
jgi:hypothetical protein